MASQKTKWPLTGIPIKFWTKPLPCPTVRKIAYQIEEIMKTLVSMNPHHAYEEVLDNVKNEILCQETFSATELKAWCQGLSAVISRMQSFWSIITKWMLLLWCTRYFWCYLDCLLLSLWSKQTEYVWCQESSWTVYQKHSRQSNWYLSGLGEEQSSILKKKAQTAIYLHDRPG